MLKKLLLLASLPTLIGAIGVHADDDTSPEKPAEMTLSPIQVGKPTRPQIPSAQVVTCSLSENGLLSITFRYGEGEAELVLDNGMETVTETFDTSAPYVTTVPDPETRYTITVTTAANHTYTGEI